MLWSVETRTPHRIPLGGGGTDVVSYSSKYGGSLVSIAVDKYIHLIINRRSIDEKIILRYSQIETVNKVSEIRHGLIRNALKEVKTEGGLEIISYSDIPTNTGMGSSGSFTVGLLHALLELNGQPVPKQALADMAYEIESKTHYEEHSDQKGLPVPFGRHDQYVAAFGGCINLNISKYNEASVVPLHLSIHAVKELEDKCLIFYTGITRRANEPLSDQSQRIRQAKTDAAKRMHQIKEIGSEIQRARTGSHINDIGPLMRQHWQAKRGVSNKMSNNQIDDWIELGQQYGSTGEKVMGAGGGGFILYFVPNPADRTNLVKKLHEAGLQQVNFRFDFNGSIVTQKEVRGERHGDTP